MTDDHLTWFLTAPYADVMMALTEDGSLLDDIRRAVIALRDGWYEQQRQVLKECSLIALQEHVAILEQLHTEPALLAIAKAVLSEQQQAYRDRHGL